jgi:hypothetical protein
VIRSRTNAPKRRNSDRSMRNMAAEFERVGVGEIEVVLDQVGSEQWVCSG